MDNFQSVLGLIPSDRFHSAVATSYSFDFSFFENVVLGQLHRAGVTNCLALIDQTMLQESLGRLSGSARTKSRGYSLVGIPSAGAFHPKLLLLAGEKEGLLFVGSGNLTASGFGGNLELWGAISALGNTEQNLDILRRAWHFISTYKDKVGGRSSVRFEWIEKHSPWLKMSQPNEVQEWLRLDNNRRCQFLSTKNVSLIRQLKDAIGTTKVTRIDIIAPFFDSELKAVRELSAVFDNPNVNIFIQPDTAQFLFDSVKHLPRTPCIYDFNQALGIEETATYLHGKCIRVATADKDYLLFGSANASAAALGGATFEGTNDEACLLLEHTGGDLLEELGIQKDKLTLIDSIRLPPVVDPGNNTERDRTIHLTAIDFNEGALEFFGFHKLGYSSADKNILRIFDGWGVCLWESPIDFAPFSTGEAVALKSPLRRDHKALFGQVFDLSTQQPTSNSQLLHDINDIFRGDPDPANRKLEAALSKLEFGETDILDVLRIIDLNILVEDPSETPEPSRKSTKGQNGNVNTPVSPGGEKLDYDTFVNDQKDSSALNNEVYKRGLQIERIFDVLTILLNKGKRIEEAIQLEEEESDFATESFDRPELKDSVKATVREESATQIRNLKKRVVRFLRQYKNRLDGLGKDPKPISVAELTRYCVISHMVIGFAGITIKEKGATEDKETKPVALLELYSDPFDTACVTGCVFNCIGAFLRASLLHVSTDVSELEAGRIQGLKDAAFFHTLFLLSLLPEKMSSPEQWNVERWNSWRWGIAQNALFALGQRAPELAALTQEFEKRLKLCPIAPEASGLVARILRLFQECRDLASGSDKTSPSIGLRAYFEKYGFVTIKQVDPIPGKTEAKVRFAGPGFSTDHDQFDFVAPAAFIWPKAKIVLFK